uniref:Uncharacterized protein n=1 Tax=Anopheles culicifacies TaxID=139723 RepID=A0A182M393_9DIPT
MATPRHYKVRLEILERYEDQKVEVRDLVVREINLVDQVILTHGERTELDVRDFVVTQVDKVERLQLGKDADWNVGDAIIRKVERCERIEIIEDVARHTVEGKVHLGHIEIVQGTEVVQKVKVFQLNVPGKVQRLQSGLIIERVLPDADELVVS